MLHSPKLVLSRELFTLTNIESRLQQFRVRTEIECSLARISHLDDDDKVAQQLADCDAALIFPWYFEKVGKCLPPSSKWIQSAWAGVQQLNSLSPEARSRLQRCKITRSADAYSPLLAEYTVNAIISMERNMREVFKRIDDRDWHRTEYVMKYRSLRGMSVGILGLGECGKEIARVCSCMGMTVHGMKTTSEPIENVHKVYTSSQLTELLLASDYVCNVLPSTSKTKGLLSNGVLKVCEKRPIGLINIGRGDIIDEKSIMEAVENGWIKSAFLDVFEHEPLPAESPLWSLKNVTITPHVAGVAAGNDVSTSFIENLENFLQGKELKYLFSWTKEY